MNTVFHITRAFIFLILASFSSTALSITINSELGSASLDGAWGRECDEGKIEVLEFAGDTFQAYALEFASMSCMGEGLIGPEVVAGSITINPVDDVQILSWVGEDNNDPPECLSGPGCTLQNSPTVTPLVAEYLDPESPQSPPIVELVFFFMDDTILDLSGGACIYNEPGPDDATEYQPYLVNDEPLCKIDTGDIPPIPVPAAFWLFGTALIGFVGYSRRRKIS